jgi:AcrR family transcriptional regulator
MDGPLLDVGSDTLPSVGDRAVDGPESAQAVRRSSDSRPGRRRLSVDERRDELISAALELFSDRPPEDISIDDVADAAGASRALVYHYFGGKQELYLAALHSAAKQLDDLLRPPAEGKPLERLAVSLHRYFDFVEDHAAGFVALLRGGPAYRSGEVGEVLDGIRGLVMNHITTSIGVEAPGPILRITLRSWMASVETAGLDWLEHRDLARTELESLLVDHHVVLLNVAARHDQDVAALLSRLADD